MTSNQDQNGLSASSINMGDLGGSGNSAAALMQSIKQQQQSRIVSAASSVVSASSLSSSSTKASTIAAGGLNGSHLKSLMKQFSEGGGSSTLSSGKSSPGYDEKKENDADPPAAAAAPATSKDQSSTIDSTGTMVLQMGAPPHPVAEFLFQLTKMLTDNNSEYIEWRNASIFVHNPPGLEKDILPKYFRHSNYSSFQRQMNYFGFRKIAGKGKMAPCSYVNEAAKDDISSLLFIKRKKTGVSSAAAKLMAQQNRINRSMMGGPSALMGGMGATNPLMMGVALNSGGLAGVPTSFNNYPMMSGVSGVGAGAGNMMSGASSLNDQTSLLREQQSMLAQLQQAHASALTSNPVPGGMGGQGAGGMSQSAQTKQYMSSSPNTGLLTNDQGNVYPSSNNSTDWSNPADAAAQSLLFQQGLGGNFSQGNGGSDPNNFTRIDSAANLRALINQQISMFNTGTPGESFPSNMNSIGASGMPSSSMGGMGAPAPGPSSQQGSGLSSLQSSGNGNQGLSYEWNEMLQRMGTGGSSSVDNVTNAAASATASLRQLEQHLLQNGNNVAQGPASASSQSFNLNGFFGSAGGTSSGSQGY